MKERRDGDLLRDLARKVAEIAAVPAQTEKRRLWKACNDLKPERPMVYADPQNGWKELDAAWGVLECRDPLHRTWEQRLRRLIVRHERIPDDFPIQAAFPVALPIRGNGYDDYGVTLRTSRSGLEGGAYHIEPVVRTLEDLRKLRFRPVRPNHAAGEEELARARDLFGDILAVRACGQRGWRYGLTRVAIHMVGMEMLLLGVYDDPGLLHALMAFLRDDFLNELDILQKEGAFSRNNTPGGSLGSGGLGYTSDLPEAEGREAGENAREGPLAPRLVDCRCWCESQETGGIGPAHFEEFVLAYQLPLMRRFGLVDYGCCEALDAKLDLLIRQVPNLRWVAVSPWADRRLAAEKLGRRFVYVYKPNPSRVCSPRADWDGAERDVRETLRIARGCAVHVVLKDTSTFCGEPHRITRWALMARRAAEEAA